MKITVKRGNDLRLDLQVSDAETVSALKQKVAQQLRLNVEEIRMFYAGKLLKDAEVLAERGLKQVPPIQLIITRVQYLPLHPSAAIEVRIIVSQLATTTIAGLNAGSYSGFCFWFWFWLWLGSSS